MLEHHVGRTGTDTLSLLIFLTFTALNFPRLLSVIINLISSIHERKNAYKLKTALPRILPVEPTNFFAPWHSPDEEPSAVCLFWQIAGERLLLVRSHKVTLHRGASVWAPFKWDPLSLPQLNTVCQYLGHQRLIMEIKHTHTCSQTHAVQTQQSADTQQQSRIASHYWTRSNNP